MTPRIETAKALAASVQALVALEQHNPTGDAKAKHRLRVQIDELGFDFQSYGRVYTAPRAVAA